MNVWLALAFLFFVGAVLGWCIEFLFRNLISKKGPRGKYFINPGICKGPYLPIWGIGLTVMFLMSYFISYDSSVSKIAVIIGIALAMTLIELIGGLYLLKVMNLRLWDYRNRFLNFKGVICPLFSLIWAAVGAVYFLLIHPMAIEWLTWLTNHLAFSFFIGLFYGIFLIDLVVSGEEARIIKRFGDDHDVIVKYEELKALVQQKLKEDAEKQTAFRQTHTKGYTLEDTLKKHTDAHEKK